jgi:hypothetical protein
MHQCCLWQGNGQQSNALNLRTMRFEPFNRLVVYITSD